MINYINADLYRIGKKKGLLISLLAYISLLLVVFFILNSPSFDENKYLSRVVIFLGFFPLFIGIPMYFSVYYDDLKSNAMQIAIGFGLLRRNIIISKLIVITILTLLSIALLTPIILLLPNALGLSLSGEQISEVISTLCVVSITIIGYMSICSLIVYWSQNEASGLILYVLLSAGTIKLILTVILNQQIIVDNFGNLNQYVFSSTVTQVQQSILAHSDINFVYVLVILAYIILPTVLAVLAFRKKELEF